jgi:dTDP-4-amino-4,6-dideoxygalactose transaminase
MAALPELGNMPGFFSNCWGFSTGRSNIFFNQSFSSLYGSDFGIYSTSGSVAVCFALSLLGVKPGEVVIAPSQLCLRTLARLAANNFRLALAPYTKFWSFDSTVLAHLIKRFSPKAIVAPHLWGLPCDLEGLRARVPEEIKIVEDAAQAWRLNYRGNSMGRHADAIATSFGPTKPCRFGAGGAVFFPSRSSMEARIHDELEKLVPMAQSPSQTMIANAVHHADMLMHQRLKRLSMLRRHLPQCFADEAYMPVEGDEPTWHRVPLLARGASPNRAYFALRNIDFECEFPRSSMPCNMPNIASSIVFFEAAEDRDLLLVKLLTRQIDIRSSND